MSKPVQQIIIKRSPKADHHGSHGGAWKVAFADFTMAMMAFFMVMWLIAMSDTDERAEIAQLLRTRSLFSTKVEAFEEANSPYPIDLGGTPSIIDPEILQQDRQAPDNPIPGMSEYLSVPSGDEAPQAGKGDKLNSLIDGQFDSPAQLSLLTDVIKQLAEDKQVAQHIQIDRVPSGLRVIIRDSNERQIFKRGQIQLTPFFEDLLLSLGGIMQRVKNKLIISGHTDAARYIGRDYSNWNLSGDRAQMARLVLVTGGMPENRVVQVGAFASTRPLDTKNPLSSQNRRVELLILTTEGERQISAMFSATGQSPALAQAAAAAYKNQPVLRTGQVLDTE